jgi:hypothetical protein
MVDATRRLEVDCRSGRAGTGPATWGQYAAWEAVRHNITLGMPVPPGVPVSLILESLRQLLPLHDALRTRLLLNDLGQLQQVVDSSGVLPVLVRQARDDEVLAQGGELLRELAGQSFDCEAQTAPQIGRSFALPWRMMRSATGDRSRSVSAVEAEAVAVVAAMGMAPERPSSRPGGSRPVDSRRPRRAGPLQERAGPWRARAQTGSAYANTSR